MAQDFRLPRSWCAPRAARIQTAVFVSEESNPKAHAVYDKINADFKKETGIEVTMEYPGFANIAKRVATLIAAGTPPDIVWYGAGTGHELAMENQLADVGDVVEDGERPAEPADGFQRRRPLDPDQPAVHLRLVPQGPFQEKGARTQHHGTTTLRRPRR